MKLAGLAAGLILMLQPPSANAERVAKCFFGARDLCECSALFTVLETEETAEGRRQIQEWRALSGKLRFWFYPVMGKELGDRLTDARIYEWRILTSTIETKREFAQVVSSCARVWDNTLTCLPVSIGP
ncbi:hypothetical protein GKC28_01605 [Leisingera sp. ANG59]|nr:hypothetical protein [Leisingera sp. ANG59]